MDKLEGNKQTALPSVRDDKRTSLKSVAAEFKFLLKRVPAADSLGKYFVHFQRSVKASSINCVTESPGVNTTHTAVGTVPSALTTHTHSIIIIIMSFYCFTVI